MTYAISRRTLMTAAGGATIGLAMPQIMVRAAQALEMAGPVGQFNRFRVGAFEVTTLTDGGRAMDDPQSIFGTNASKEDVGKLLTENLLPEDQLFNTFTPTLVNTGTDLILFDTGLGEGARENGMGRTISALKASGYTPDQVTVVVLTHMHGDHIGGLMEGGAPAYPNARYVTAQAEFDFWNDDARMGTPAEGGHQAVRKLVAPLAERTTFIADGGEVVSGIRGMAAFGHTPGHMIYRIDSEGRQLAITADTANHYILSLQRPDWEVRFDMDKAQAAQARKTVFGMLAADRIPFVGYHMPVPAIGYVEAMGDGFRYIPETYQLDL